jgi:hypothetical protein
MTMIKCDIIDDYSNIKNQKVSLYSKFGIPKSGQQKNSFSIFRNST